MPPEPTLARAVSQLCTAAQFAEPDYAHWCGQIREAPRLHRKQWEFCFILSALEQGRMLRPGRRGVGFGVGQEPLPALLAGMGIDVLATDLGEDEADQLGWTNGQHASAIAQLNNRNICPGYLFDQHVRHRVVDMNAIPTDIRGYDFTWSACALEHLGSIELGLAFIRNSLNCLKPGGLAIHTTEFNVRSDEETLESGGTVLFRRRDIEGLAAGLRAQGHAIELNLNPGEGEMDQHIDVAPYSVDRHLKLELAGYVTTSIGLIIRKAG
ncbi:methyltransferase domain-containing protein [Rhodovarius crocodyli]|uniref:class I SAM-dependent methyltransferase n=1 Tax=Rhodovarius crocodyli TaxID=1979269 RepID=UPI00197D6A51|nr:class I SAM-dependent methyltransferase [Rhodovarius crocodyli]